MSGVDQNCAACRVMRSLAYTGVGMAIGGGVAYVFGASQQDCIMSGIVVAAIIVFGLLDNTRNKEEL